LAAVAAMALACSSNERNASLSLSTGGETDVFTRAPAPSTLVVDMIDAKSGTETNLVRAKLPTTNVDLGERDPLALVRVRVNAVDDTGRVLVTGRSMPMQFGAIEGLSIPIFVQRTGEMARMPGSLGDARLAPNVVGVIGQYVFVTGGDDAALAKETQIYDLASLSRFTKPPTMPLAPVSVAPFGTKQLLIDGGGATWFELSDSSTEAVTAPSGGSFAEIAGGKTIIVPDGSMYVVGATRRSGEPTSRVLRVSTDGSLAFVSLKQARLGASAAWVVGRGLVVTGGSKAEGSAGAETIADSATEPVALPFPTDETSGASAAVLDAAHILVAGGVDELGQSAPTRVFDLACTAACVPAVWDGAKLPVPLVGSDAFALDAGSILLVGDDADGASHALRVSAQAAQDIPFKVPRRGARAVVVNPPAITIVGGSDVIESFTP